MIEVACGMVSQYNISDPDKKYGVKNLSHVVGKRLKMQGFIVGDPDVGPKYAAEHQRNVSKWISEGTFVAQQSVTDGIDNAVKGFLGMLKGENFGKAVLKIDDLKVNLPFVLLYSSIASMLTSAVMGLSIGWKKKGDNCF